MSELRTLSAYEDISNFLWRYRNLTGNLEYICGPSQRKFDITLQKKIMRAYILRLLIPFHTVIYS